ncbi:flavodoxin family protein [uncultured Pseudomonas sp.]|uniref:flavodoxin family protein n=1 Tax=uncultured Pseudomonas sp. TaxID=114707 RepID=UPI0025CE4F7F|nr:flavodoxin domain-containing protein [uncultured Pseudomonas sp.]
MVIFSTISGTTRKVAQRVAERIGDSKILDARTAMTLVPNHDIRYVLLFCPTYGDEEAEEDFETLLISYDWSALSGTAFAFCELGIYTGYEDFGHGLVDMVRQTLTHHGLRELVPPLSVDTVPITDWAMVDVWADLVSSRLAETA